MDKVIFATGNQNKMREIRMILADLPFQVLSMKEAGIEVQIEETGKTFEENALIKAKAVHPFTDGIVLADDSGLEVDYLHQAPGIYSSRFLGEETSYQIKNQYIIDQLKGVSGSDRSARFVCAIAIVFPDGSQKTCRGVMEGQIAYEPAGKNGFGYDPIFYLPEYGCTSAQLAPEEKNAISHRGKALRAMKKILQESM